MIDQTQNRWAKLAYWTSNISCAYNVTYCNKSACFTVIKASLYLYLYFLQKMRDNVVVYH